MITGSQAGIEKLCFEYSSFHIKNLKFNPVKKKESSLEKNEAVSEKCPKFWLCKRVFPLLLSLRSHLILLLILPKYKMNLLNQIICEFSSSNVPYLCDSELLMGEGNLIFRPTVQCFGQSCGLLWTWTNCDLK